MRLLPDEGHAPKTPNKKYNHSRPAKASLHLAKYKGELKKISLRLNQFADRDLNDPDVLRLLEDTRSQVLGMHIARKKLRKDGKKK